MSRKMKMWSCALWWIVHCQHTDGWNHNMLQCNITCFNCPSVQPCQQPANHHFTLQLTLVKSSWIMNEHTVIVLPTAKCIKVKPHCGHRLSLNITTKQLLQANVPAARLRESHSLIFWSDYSVCFHGIFYMWS